MASVALQAALCYNEDRNIVVAQQVLTHLLSPFTIRRVGSYRMDILRSNSPDSNPEKQCKGPCGRMLPTTNEFFVLAKKNKDGLSAKCKDCNNLEWRLKHPNAKPRGKHTPQFDVPEGQKRCSGCKDIFPATSDFFSHNKRTKDGLYWQCKSCKGEDNTAYRSRPEVQEQIQTYRNSPEFKAHNKVYRKRPEVHERLRIHMKNYQSRPEVYQRALAYTKARYHHPEIGKYIHARNRAYNHLQRARKRAVLGTYTHGQIEAQLKRQKYRCYYAACGHAKFEKRDGSYVYHVDHTFPISRVTGTDIPANSIDYLVLACPHCNLSKNDRFPWEWPEGGRLL